MKTVIKNILEVILPVESGFTAHSGTESITKTFTRKEMIERYIALPIYDLLKNRNFIYFLARYLWNNAPRSKRTKPKVIWPEGMLNYEKFEYLVEDIQALFGSTIMDGSTEEYLQEFYEKNLLPNIK